MASQDNDGLDVNDFYNHVINDPKVAEKIREVARNYRDDLKLTWTKDTETLPDTAKFTHLAPGDVFVVIDTTDQEGRPVSIVEARHPYAVAHQARTGAFTKAAGKNFNEEW